MAETKYGIMKATPSLPSIDLLKIPHKERDLIVAVFGPNTYSTNREEMQKRYSHSQEFPEISFREPTTSESISAATYDVVYTKKTILDPKWLQLGYIVRASEGFYANPPKDKQGNPIKDEKTLKIFLNKAKKVNGIYLCENDFGFAPYETFKRGEQDCDIFVESGLARLLEYTEEKTAQNLKTIASPKFYKRGINVWGFSEVKEPVLRVASLGSDWDLYYDRLGIDGNFWGDFGCVFGVFSKTGEASSQKL